MVSTTLVVSGAVHAVAASAFLVVARESAIRVAGSQMRDIGRRFSLWWLCLGSYMAIQAALIMSAAFTPVAHDVVRASRVVTIPILCASVWGLTSYLIYLYTGKARGLPLGLFYTMVLAAFYWVTFGQGTLDVRQGPWLVELAYADSSVMYKLVLVAVGLPPIGASIAYIALGLRVEDPQQKYRAIMVGVGILAWVGSGLVARLAGVDVLAFATLAPVGLIAAALTVLAYKPPRFVRHHLAAGPHGQR